MSGSYIARAIIISFQYLFTTLLTVSFHCCFGDGLLISSSILPKSYFHRIFLTSINQLLVRQRNSIFLKKRAIASIENVLIYSERYGHSDLKSD